MKMDLIRSIDYQRAVEAGGESEDLDAFESTQEFQQIGKGIIDAAVDRDWETILLIRSIFIAS